MFQIAYLWNVADPSQIYDYDPSKITLRGNFNNVALPGEFLTKIKSLEEEIESAKNKGYKKGRKKSPRLSIGDICDNICEARRDLYLKKGINKPSNLEGSHGRWGNHAGIISENYMTGLYNEGNNDLDSNISELCSSYHGSFCSKQDSKFNEMIECEVHSKEKKGSTEWLKSLLKCASYSEIGLKKFLEIVPELKEIGNKDIIVAKKDLQIRAKDTLGLSKSVEPDFIIPNKGIVGDIKTGTLFKSDFQITCTGYAMAYESANPGEQINWGIIYFIPTRLESSYCNCLHFPQVYIFPIDDNLRNRFLSRRNKSYEIIFSDKMPDLPEDKNKCEHCRHFSYCNKGE